MLNFIYLCSRFIIIPKQRKKQINQVCNNFELHHIQEQLRNSLQQKLVTENNELSPVSARKSDKNLLPLFFHFLQNQES